MELLGPSMTSLAESHAANHLPGEIALKFAKQVVQGIAYVHRLGVVHGGLLGPAFLIIQPVNCGCLDLHPGNIVLVDQTISERMVGDIFGSMDSPVTGEVHGGALDNPLPRYLVLPSALPLDSDLSKNRKMKLIDFGSAFLSGDSLPKMRCPLPFRAPVAVMTGS